MAASVIAENIINQVLRNSDTLISDTRDYASSAMFGLEDLRNNIPSVGSSFISSLIEYDPSKFVPTQDLRGEYENKYSEMFDKLTPLAKKEFDDMMARLFPSDNIWNDLGTFLYDSVNNGSIGLPEHIENQIWQRLRDRENIQLKTSIDNAYNEIGSRGFSIPPGFVAGATVSLTNNANKNLSAQNRDIAIRIAELKIDWIKYSIQNIIEMRKIALQNALEFMNNIYKSASSAQQKSSGYVNSHQALYSSLNAYVNSVSSINDIRYKIDNTNKDYAIRRAQVQSNIELGISKIKADGAVELVKSMGVLAGSVSSGINALANVAEFVNN